MTNNIYNIYKHLLLKCWLCWLCFPYHKSISPSSGANPLVLVELKSINRENLSRESLPAVMSDVKLRKYLEKTSDLEIGLGPRKCVPILLSDSKGSYLSRQVSNRIESNIVWKYRSGRNSQDGLEWVQTHIDAEIEKYELARLYVWLGTCDLTEKSKKFISLKAEDEKACAKLIRRFKIISNVAKRKKFRVTFLELPVYSIKEWNRHAGHKDPESFDKQDRDLQVRITVINEYIRKINEENRTRSPKFSLDLIRSRKYKGRSCIYRYNFGLYKDDIHPNPLLSQYWVRKVAEQVKSKCY